MIGPLTLMPFVVEQIYVALSLNSERLAMLGIFASYIESIVFVYEFVFISINPIGYFIGPTRPTTVILSMIVWVIVMCSYRHFRLSLAETKLQLAIFVYMMLGATYHFLHVIFPFHG